MAILRVSFNQTFREAKREFERSYVLSVLMQTKGNVSAAARLADKDRKDFYDLMKRNGINPQNYRDLFAWKKG